MKYVANPVIVDAYKIVKILRTFALGEMELLLDNDDKVITSIDMTSRMIPKDGDYYVIQSDGYIYLNPKEVFERKYSQLKE